MLSLCHENAQNGNVQTKSNCMRMLSDDYIENCWKCVSKCGNKLQQNHCVGIKYIMYKLLACRYIAWIKSGQYKKEQVIRLEEKIG